MSPFTIIVIVFILLFLTIKLANGSYDILDAFVFALPFKYAVIQIGFAVLLSQALMTIFVLTVIAKKLLVSPKNFKVVPILIVFIIYAILDTFLVTHIAGIEAIKVRTGSSFFREEGRYLLQIFVFVYFYLQVFAVKNWVDSNEKIVKILKVFLLSFNVLLILGFVQFVIFRLTGQDIFPIGTLEGTTKTAVLETLGQSFARVTSLAGEPKGMGVYAVFGLAVLVVLNRYKIVTTEHYYLNLGLCIFIIIFTFSTSAYGLLAIFIGFYFLVQVLGFKKPFLWTKKNLLVVLLVMGGVVLFADTIYTILDQRVFSKMSSEGSSEASDLAIIDFWEDHPEWLYFGSGLGNIHNLAMEYTPERHRRYMYNNVWVARTGFLKIVSELGIVGMLFFIFIIISTFLRFGLAHNKDPLGKSLAIILFLSVLFYLFRGPYIENEFLLILSLAFAYNKREISQLDEINIELS